MDVFSPSCRNREAEDKLFIRWNNYFLEQQFDRENFVLLFLIKSCIMIEMEKGNENWTELCTSFVFSFFCRKRNEKNLIRHNLYAFIFMDYMFARLYKMKEELLCNKGMEKWFIKKEWSMKGNERKTRHLLYYIDVPGLIELHARTVKYKMAAK